MRASRRGRRRAGRRPPPLGLSLHHSLLSPAGEAIGSARPAVGKLGGNLLIRDAGGLPVATAAASGRRWVVRVESRASSLLRDAALALALIQLRSD